MVARKSLRSSSSGRALRTSSSFEPAPARLANAEAQVSEAVHAVGIGVDAHQHPRPLRLLTGGVQQVEPLGMGVELEETAAPGGVPNDAEHVDIVGLPVGDQPAEGVGEDRKVRVVHRPQDALGLLGAAEIEPAVDGADDEVEIAENVIGKIEASILENIDLDPFQQRDAEPLLGSSLSISSSWLSRRSGVSPRATATRRECSVIAM